jgi:aarF domain-containing kinase
MALLQFDFRLPPYFARILRALAALEGTASSIDPDFKVIERAYPYVLARLLADRSPEMRDILRRLVLGPG